MVWSRQGVNFPNVGIHRNEERAGALHGGGPGRSSRASYRAQSSAFERRGTARNKKSREALFSV